MNRFTKQLLPFSSLIFIISLWTCLEPHRFLTLQNWENVLSRSSVNGIMAAGMTFVIITAGIDLSVGSMLALCGIVGSVAMLFASGANWEMISSGQHIEISSGAALFGVLIGMLAGALFGFANGTLITRLKLAPFIVTLGTMSVFRGVSYLTNAGKPIAVSDFSFLDSGSILGLPAPIALLAIVLFASGLILSKTPFGRYVYAIGSNPETAFHAGINIGRIQTLLYTITGALVGLAGMITTARASSAQPTAGIALELDVIAAVIIGGCSPSGGRGSIVGTIIGTFLISFLRNGLSLLGLSTNVQLVVIGLIIIVAVSIDQVATRRRA